MRHEENANTKSEPMSDIACRGDGAIHLVLQSLEEEVDHLGCNLSTLYSVLSVVVKPSHISDPQVKVKVTEKDVAAFSQMWERINGVANSINTMRGEILELTERLEL